MPCTRFSRAVPIKEVVLDDIEAPSGVRVTLLDGGQSLESTHRGQAAADTHPRSPFRQLAGAAGVRTEACRSAVGQASPEPRHPGSALRDTALDFRHIRRGAVNV